MKMNKFMASIFTAGLLALAACTNDENDPVNGSGNDQEGVKTWARLDIKVGGPTTRAVVEENGTLAESKVENVHVYVFNEAGQFEAKTDVATPENSHGTVHSATLALTSGKKKIYVVANMEDAWMPTPVPTTQTEFEAVLRVLCTTPGRLSPAVPRGGDNFKDLTGGADGAKGFLMSNVLTGIDFTLHAGISKEQASQADYATPEDMEKNNHLQISLFRAAAKIQVSYDNASALEVNSTTVNKVIGVLDPASLRFAVRNVPKSTYMFLHNRDNGFLTPHYTATNTSSDEAAFAAIFDETEAISNEVKLASNSPVSVYVPENANQTPTLGNTTYAIIQAVFRPKANVMINELEVTGVNPDVYDLVYKYNATDYTANADAIPAFFTVDDKIFTVSGVDGMSEDERAEKGRSMILKHYLHTNGKNKFLKAIDAGSKVNEGDVTENKYVYYTCSLGTPDGIYQVAKVVKHTESPVNSNVFVEEEVASVRFLQYDGGTVYYRVNIEDNEDGKTDSNNLYYSVMRNRFYKVNINSVSAVGVPKEDDDSTDPSDPVNSKTYMQAHITVEKWRVVSQDADLGK